MQFIKKSRKIVSLILAFVLSFSFCFVGANYSASAKTESQIRNEINALESKSQQLEKEISALKSKKAAQTKIKNAIEAKIANTQRQIDVCNAYISQYNAEIAANEAKIAQKQKEKEDTIFLFKQRLRTIHMSNGSSTIQVLLGAENFSDYLALAQLTKVIAAHDKKIVEKIISIVDEINAAQVEINNKIAAQNDVKKVLAEKKAELDAQVNEVNGVISVINGETNQIQNENRKTEADIKALNAELAPYIYVQTGAVYDGSAFTWPVPGHYGITSGFGYRWGTMHSGIDISDGGVNGAAIVAAADGIVVRSNNSCTHNYRKNRSCGCGSGWGNYVMIDHGNNSSGTNFKTLCGHMTRAVVSAGQSVKKGQVIGYVGCTGYSTGPHCHFEIYVNGTRVNPLNYFNKVK